MLGKFIERLRGWWSSSPPKTEAPKKPKVAKPKAPKPKKTVEGNPNLLGIVEPKKKK